MDPTAEALTQEPGHQWETGGASNQVDTGDVGQVRTAVVKPADQRSHRGQGALDERAAGLVQVDHGKDAGG